MLCGVDIDHAQGLAGHSDADVAVHALMDALLGAAGLGDIGELFPDTDPAFEDVSSIALLARVMAWLTRGRLVRGERRRHARLRAAHAGGLSAGDARESGRRPWASPATR